LARPPGLHPLVSILGFFPVWLDNPIPKSTQSFGFGRNPNRNYYFVSVHLRALRAGDLLRFQNWPEGCRMNRRHFFRISCAIAPGVMILPAEALILEALFIAGGLVIGGTGLFMAWKLYKCYKHHFPDPAPPAVPTNGSTNGIPYMPPVTNAPPAIRPTKNMGVLEGGNVTAVDVSDCGLILPDSSPVIYYSKFEFESSPDQVVWNRETTLETWAGDVGAVIQTGLDTQWCPDRKNIWLSLQGGDPKKFYRMNQAATLL
jgi:hypothetical protein